MEIPRSRPTLASDLLSVSPPDGKPASLHDSARGSPEPFAQVSVDRFHQLVDNINYILGPCNGIDSDDVNVKELEHAMREYSSNEQEWQKYAFADYSRGYTRNLVDSGNGKCNLLILVWTPGKGSPVHDHANAHCVMKILKGSLKETLYRFPCQRFDAEHTPTTTLCHSTEHACSVNGALEPAALQVKRATIYNAGEVTYMSDQLGLHKIENPSPDEVAISLHLYTPPNAAKFGCNVFVESTGRRLPAQQCHFYSQFGVKIG